MLETSFQFIPLFSNATIFWLMGVLPMIYGGMMFADSRMQPIRALPCFRAANGAGIIGLTPYLLRLNYQSVPRKQQHKIVTKTGCGRSVGHLALLQHCFWE